MRSLRLHAARDLRFHDEEIPVISGREVLLKIQSVGICGSDMHRYRKGEDAASPLSKPLILGHEFTAVVEKAGRDREHLQPGTRVAVDPAIPCGRCEWCLRGDENLCPGIRFCGVDPVDGALRQHMAWPAENCYPLPEECSNEEGALLETLGVALHSVDLANYKQGQSAAVIGCGPVGLLIIQLLARRNVPFIAAADILRYRLSAAGTCGAGSLHNPKTGSFEEFVKHATNGRGVDIVFEAAGALETPRTAAESVAPGGKIVFVGINPDERMEYRSAPLRRKGLTIKMVRRMKKTYPRAIKMFIEKEINFAPLLTHTFQFAKAPEAYRLVDRYEDSVIKATITLEDS